MDPTNRYVVSDSLTKNYFQFWVLDMYTGKFIARADRPRIEHWYVGYTEVEWSEGRAEIDIEWDLKGTRMKQETVVLRWQPD